MHTVFQFDRLGMFAGTTTADESPLEPGVVHMPAGTTDVAPPDEWPGHQWPRWNGAAWLLVNKPQRPVDDPARKLAEFLAANPDVAAMVAAQVTS